MREHTTPLVHGASPQVDVRTSDALGYQLSRAQIVAAFAG
jgi:hypothetical protein